MYKLTQLIKWNEFILKKLKVHCKVKRIKNLKILENKYITYIFSKWYSVIVIV